MNNIYYIRTIAAHYAEMINIGKVLGAIAETDDGRIYATQGGCWDYIGPIHVPTGEVTDTEIGPVPVTTPLLDPDGNEYIHVNLITPISLKETAIALAAEHPEVAAGLSNLGKYFLLDAEGNARLPTNPHRVFAGM